MDVEDELLAVARRCIWWMEPSVAVTQTSLFLCHVMVYGLWEDAALIRKRYSPADMVTALESAPAGLFDARSWHYWHGVLGLPVPPLPVRRIPGSKPQPPLSKLDFHLVAGNG